MSVDAFAAPYRAHVGPGQPYALVDFPDHANVGDSAIWLGELAILRALTGCGPVYVSTWHDFDAAAFRRACPEGPLFLHGGGNLGDIWPHHQQFREAVLAGVRDRPVVQLPQSVQFRDPARANRFAALVADHPAFTLYVRDHASLAFAARFACPVHLVPDSAMALGPQPRGEAAVPLLMLLRSDDERRDHGAPPTAGARVVDWLEDDAAMPAGTSPAAREAQATARVARGLRLLAQGETVVTDRLHGAILAALLGMRPVVLDNDYGKIARYLAAWPLPAVTATTMAEAVAMAAGLSSPPGKGGCLSLSNKDLPGGGRGPVATLPVEEGDDRSSSPCDWTPAFAGEAYVLEGDRCRQGVGGG